MKGSAAGYIPILGTVLLMTYAQLAMKWGLSKAGRLPAGLWSRLGFLLGQVLTPWVLSGLAAAAVAALLWIIVLTRFDVSRAYPFMGLSFVLVLLLSHIMFREELSITSILGAALVIAGVTMVGLGK